jgi:hypothetical protein
MIILFMSQEIHVDLTRGLRDRKPFFFWPLLLLKGPASGELDS